MIRLTKPDGTFTVVNADQITNIEIHGNTPYTEIITTNKEVIVSESWEEVARKVLEYRLLMEQYKACQMLERLEDANYIDNDLKHLAGLEKGE